MLKKFQASAFNFSIMDYERINLTLVANKCDVNESEREVTTEQGQLLSIELDIPFMETSAKENTNVTEVWDF